MLIQPMHAYQVEDTTEFLPENISQFLKTTLDNFLFLKNH